jgi:N6-adenosine-specific RNA methylase IME4
MIHEIQLSELVDAKGVAKWLGEFQKTLLVIETPQQASRMLKAIDLATEYVRKLKLGVTVEMEVVETAIFTEFALGQTLKRAKEVGELDQGGRPPTKPVTNEDRFSLKDVDVTKNESSHAQRFVEFVNRFDLDSLRDLVREQKLARTLSRSGVYKTIDQALRRREHKEKVKSATSTEAVAGPFDVIIADPPWQYENASTESRAIDNQYAPASLEEIKKHAPNAAKHSVLFLWATAPKLCEAIEVLNAWGFVYRTNAIWDKQVLGMGYWFRIQHELLLVGVCGHFSPPDDFNRVGSIFSEKRLTHSTKPQVVYDWIESVWPEERKLEMYARQERPGWAVWGNEV